MHFDDLGKETSMDFTGLKHTLPVLMVRFQSTTLISVGLKILLSYDS